MDDKLYYKATRLDGLSFHASANGLRPRYLPGDRITIPADRRNPKLCSPGVIHASDVPGETLIGGSWPCRLFEVRGTPVASDGHKHGFYANADTKAAWFSRAFMAIEAIEEALDQEKP